VKFGVIYNTGHRGVDPDGMIAVARHAEDRGFESFYMPEHVALYPGASVGEVSFPPDLPVADPLECLAFVAAATDRILLGTGVLLLPYHQPTASRSADPMFRVYAGMPRRHRVLNSSFSRACCWSWA
jgi:alkanesulfonate monooxygenase SsuD/methylene tetrahydromethanopterin reductase-like flavin-dependent oxidoreductase (luciferase family)